MMSPLKIITLNRVFSDKQIGNVFTPGVKPPAPAAQKFNRLLNEGIAGQAVNFTCFSYLPVDRKNCRHFFFPSREYQENGVLYHIPFLCNFPGLKTLVMILMTAFFLLKSARTQKTVAVCDTSVVPLMIGLWLVQWHPRIFSVACVTDIYSITAFSKISFRERIFNGLFAFFTTRMQLYFLLTSPMNRVVNPKNKPSIVIEAIADMHMENVPNELSGKAPEKIILYAGVLSDNYCGIRNVLEAFLRVRDPMARLHLYGGGDFEPELNDYLRKDARIQYFGWRSNEQIVKQEIEATLLINLRPAHAEFTKYSFPSKNVECMASGTPLLTTRLPGMPQEYYPYVFLCDDETVVGISESFSHILSLPAGELHDFGMRSKEFVLKYKNNKAQARRLLDFIEQNVN